MSRLLAILIVAAVAATAVLLSRSQRTAEIRAGVALADVLGGADTAGYARAVQPRAFHFPEDHGPHPAFRTEWWYFTGNLTSASGRRLGYQLTFFRSALSADARERGSAWAARDAYMAHFALTDGSSGRFFAREQFARGAVGLAGAAASPFAVHVNAWRARATHTSPFPLHLSAASDSFAIDLLLEEGRPPVLQGDAGLSRKGPSPGNASYYYSLTRMPTTGSVTIAGERFDVAGTSWMDREWSTSALEDAVGWDWFALQLPSGELMLYQLRDSAGKKTAQSAGTWTTNGGTLHLGPDDVAIEVLEYWKSPRTGTQYPSRWHVSVSTAGLNLDVRPLVPAQELVLYVHYWEGAVEVTGSERGQPVTGRGYVELTGYERRRDGAATLR